MDIGSTVAWTQIAIWGIGGILYIGRLLRNEVPMPNWLKNPLSSNKTIGVVIALGLIVSGISQYQNWQERHQSELKLTISAYEPNAGALVLIRDQTFENDNIPLDGHAYDNVTFINSCLLYSGGAYQLQNVTFKKNWRICTGDQRMKNYMALMRGMGLMKTHTVASTKSVIKQP